MKVLFLILAFLAGIWSWWFQELLARKNQLPKAPTFRQLAWESCQPNFQSIPIDDRWHNQPATFFSEPPTMMLGSDMLRCHVWQTVREGFPTGTTVIVWRKGLEFPWTISFVGDDMVMANVGDTRGARFLSWSLKAEDRAFLRTFLSNIRTRLNPGS